MSDTTLGGLSFACFAAFSILQAEPAQQTDEALLCFETRKLI